MPITSDDYRSFMLRLWREGKGEAWRALLKDISTGARRNFADLQSLVAFLQEQIADQQATRKMETRKKKVIESGKTK